jgi:hypothetical protein
MADERKDRPDAEKIARDAGGEIGEAVTRAANAAGTAILRVGELAGDALLGFFGSAVRPAAPLATDVLPELRPLLPVQAGDEVQTRVKLINEGEYATEPFTLSATDLVSDAGERIAADAVVLPPDQRVLDTKLSDTVPLTVKVPADAKPGVYRGEVTGDDDGVAAAQLVLEVR